MNQRYWLQSAITKKLPITDAKCSPDEEMGQGGIFFVEMNCKLEPGLGHLERIMFVDILKELILAG